MLAESWTGEPGDTEYVFTLREGVTFHDGTPLNAEAVKINFDRMQNFDETDQASAYYYGALMDGFGPDNLISSVEATGDLEVTITLREPSPTFLFGITLTPFSIISPAILESTGADSSETSTLGYRRRAGRHRSVRPRGLHPGRQRRAGPQRRLLGRHRPTWIG